MRVAKVLGSMTCQERFCDGERILEGDGHAMQLPCAQTQFGADLEPLDDFPLLCFASRPRWLHQQIGAHLDN